jgi:hypothetical protein
MCSITKGDQPLKIWWTFKPDDVSEFPYNLTTGDGIMITRPSSKMSVLGIENVKSRHRGTYQCVASNNAGTVFHSAFLSINGLNYFSAFFFFIFSSHQSTPKSLKNGISSEFCNI